MTYTPASLFRRTDAERADEALSWARDDHRFFAAGACHILAWTFLEKYGRDRFAPVGIRYLPSPWVNHVYVSDGVRAFDFFGWTTEEELLTTSAGTAEGGMERVEIGGIDLETFCRLHNSRSPSDFHGDVRKRAGAYLTQFPPP